jgi:EAL domain-containing protein (putative c-di-GMP-specific phosphodiesterase class I)
MALRHRLMADVDKAMVSLALDQLKKDGSGPNTIALNLSSQSIADSEFLNWFAKQLDEFGKQGKRLAVEISEFTALRNRPAVLNIRDMVWKHKGQFGIDHFGADPQALTDLREVLPDYVKLSAYLLEDAGAALPERELLQSIVKLAHSLEIQVIAQKLERPEQVAALLAIGVDAGQGNFFAAPH